MTVALIASRLFARGFHVSARRTALSKFNMPAMSPTMTEGGIASWKKKEGESFTSGDVLLEIETDKATIDVEAQDDGILAKIIAPDGSKNIQVGSVIAIVGEEGDNISGASELATATTSGSQNEQPQPNAQPPAQPLHQQPSSLAPEPPELPTSATSDYIFASPIAKRIALERGVPLSQVKGTGPSGRIIRADVEGCKVSTSPGPMGQLSEFDDTPVSAMRRTISSRLSQSKQEVPHYYLTADINMDRVLKLKDVFNSSLSEQSPTSKLSVNDFIMKGAACALADVPEVNSAWFGDSIRTYKKADISMAVATPSGLITPIVRDAGAKGLATISSDVKLLVKKARDGKLTPEEYQGGTFTISNLGMFGISHFTAIINPPQSCILAVGSTQPTVIPSPDKEGEFKTIQVMKVTLSCDHRVVDGAVGARWLSAFKAYLENPLTFML